MPKNLVIAVFGSLLIFCVGAQLVSVNRAGMGKVVNSQYYDYKIH